jgi:hypothetical protein
MTSRNIHILVVFCQFSLVIERYTPILQIELLNCILVQGAAILPSMPVRVSDKMFCLCILFCTGNLKCNWYAGTITVNSELDSASNDIYFLNVHATVSMHSYRHTWQYCSSLWFSAHSVRRISKSLLSALIAQVVVNPTTIWSWPRRPLFFLRQYLLPAQFTKLMTSRNYFHNVLKQKMENFTGLVLIVRTEYLMPNHGQFIKLVRQQEPLYWPIFSA